MQHERTFIEEISYQYKHGGMHIRLILMNTIFYFVILLLSVLEHLTLNPVLGNVLNYGFTLQTSPEALWWTPLGLITSIFSHFSFLHFVLNMLFLFMVGGIFRQLFTDRRMLHVYVLGGIFGGLFELGAHLVFPIFQGSNSAIVGASGSIMALFFAVALYRPNMQVSLFGILPIRLIWLAAIFVVSELLQMFKEDNVAHFAHIGGAVLGALSINKIHSVSNIINVTEGWQQRILSGRSKNKSRSHLKAERGGARMKSDEAYNMERKENQERIDKILDKISKSGYESLTKAEKEFLFSQGKK